MHHSKPISCNYSIAFKIVCLDGAIKKIKRYSEESHRNFNRGPDFIIGDFDSIDEDSINWLKNKVLQFSFVLLFASM